MTVISNNKYNSSLKVVVGIDLRLGQSQKLSLHWVFSLRSPFSEHEELAKGGESRAKGSECPAGWAWCGGWTGGVSCPSPSNEKGTPASFFASSYGTELSTRPVPNQVQLAQAVPSGAGHCVLTAGPASLGGLSSQVSQVASVTSSAERVGEGHEDVHVASQGGSGMAEGKGQAQRAWGQMIENASFDPGMDMEASSGHSHGS